VGIFQILLLIINLFRL